MARDVVATDKRRIQDSDGSNLAINDIGAIIAAPDEHERTAQDVEFFYQHEFVNVTAGSTVTIAIVTNSKFPHGHMLVNSDNDLSMDLTLSTVTPGTFTGGTQDYQFNINRGANHERSVASFYFGDISAGTSGCLHKTLQTGRMIAGRFSVPNEQSSVDWLLDDERVYIVHFTNNGNDTAWILFKYRYHEHEPTSVNIATGSGEGEAEYDAAEPA